MKAQRKEDLAVESEEILARGEEGEAVDLPRVPEAEKGRVGPRDLLSQLTLRQGGIGIITPQSRGIHLIIGGHLPLLEDLAG